MTDEQSLVAKCGAPVGQKTDSLAVFGRKWGVSFEAPPVEGQGKLAEDELVGCPLGLGEDLIGEGHVFHEGIAHKSSQF